MYSLIIIILLLLSISSSTGERSGPIKFSPDHFAVHLNPFWSKLDQNIGRSYTFDEIYSFISTITTRFHKLSIISPPIQPSQLANFEYILTAVATYNNASPSDPLELFLEVEFPLEEDSSGTHRKSLTHTLTLADEANSIYPGTVKTILTYDYKLTGDNTRNLPLRRNIALRVIMREINGSRFKYNFGMILMLGHCEPLIYTFPTYMREIVRLVDMIMFFTEPNQDSISKGVNSTFPLTYGAFSSCTRKMRRIRNDIRIGYKTTWVDTESVTDLVEYWKRINDYVIQSNTTAIMLQAFDVPFAPIPLMSRSGWWRLGENSTSLEASHFDFIEKESLLLMRKANYASPEIIEVSSTKISCRLPSMNGSKFDEEMSETKVAIIVGVVIGEAVLIVAVVLSCQAILNKLRNHCRKPEPKARPEILAGERGSVKSLELKVDTFAIDEESVLGYGQFAIVFKGILIRDKKKVDVAVKTNRVDNSEEGKSLILEAKLMSNVGQHENLVAILGICTGELESVGKVWMFLEMCGLGSLEKCLRSNNSSVFRMPDLNVEGQLTIQDFERWCLEIASGMAFLASKNVVHADLATRNVLLSKDKTAKISDFGLSRRMYNYSVYTKTTPQALPWRWMPPESLRNLEFCEKSDVWSYGVTVWEIFSFVCPFNNKFRTNETSSEQTKQVPNKRNKFHNKQTTTTNKFHNKQVPFVQEAWCFEFVTRLENGIRLERPSNMSIGTYEILLRCWKTVPQQRPTFATVLNYLSSELAEVNYCNVDVE